MLPSSMPSSCNEGKKRLILMVEKEEAKLWCCAGVSGELRKYTQPWTANADLMREISCGVVEVRLNELTSIPQLCGVQLCWSWDVDICDGRVVWERIVARVVVFWYPKSVVVFNLEGFYKEVGISCGQCKVLQWFLNVLLVVGGVSWVFFGQYLLWCWNDVFFYVLVFVDTHP